MISQPPDTTLSPLTDAPPDDAEGMLLELGDGESGFSGTPVGSGDATLQEYIEECRSLSRGENVREGWVPSTTYWIVHESKAAGLLRLRHYLNDALRHKGGHIGYYVRPAQRGTGVATRSLALALPLAKALGENRVMLTTNPANTGSVRVIEANGGTLEATVIDQDSETQPAAKDGPETETILQYWINT